MRTINSPGSVLAAFALAFFANASTAWADFVTFTASGSGGLSASATFEVSGTDLIVTLTNTSSMDVWVPSQVLTGVWFSAPGSMVVMTAEVAPGSGVNSATSAGNGAFPDVGGEFAYRGGLSMNFGSNSGISSSGLGVFGPGDRFNGHNLAGPTSPDGLQYGITSHGDNPSTGNGGISGTPLIQNSVVFVLCGWRSNWNLSSITNVFFQYGTSLDDTRLRAVPEPGVLALLGLGLVGMVFAVRKFSWA